MALHHTTHTSNALYRVFVQPFLSHQSKCLVPAIQQRRTVPISYASKIQPSASYATSRPRPMNNKSRQQAPARTQKYDNEITAFRIYLVDPITNLLDRTLRDRRQVMQNIDTRTHRLVQVSSPEDEARGEAPVCKIVNKQEEYEAAKRRRLALKDSKRANAVAQSVKTLELNWAIDPNDLSHRMSKMVRFLDEGRKVEIMLASKKAGRRASVDECAIVLKKIRDVVDGVPGAKELATEGKMGNMFTMLLQGPMPKIQTEQNPS